MRIYNIRAGIRFDPVKSARNVAIRGLSFALAYDFDWNAAWIVEDLRHDYGERRWQALGPIGDRLHMLVFTVRSPDIHVISLRKANDREVRQYEAQEQAESEADRSDQSGMDA